MPSLTKRQMAIVRRTRPGHGAEQQVLRTAVKSFLFIPVFLLFLTGPAYGDRGPVIWQERLKLSQKSQKAIILHNSHEEVLILGTEFRASKEMQVLEFIPNEEYTVKIWIRGDADAAPLKGRTYISRAGFNKDRTRALVYVEHTEGPGQGVGYYVTLEKRGGEWQITSSKSFMQNQ